MWAVYDTARICRGHGSRLCIVIMNTKSCTNSTFVFAYFSLICILLFATLSGMHAIAELPILTVADCKLDEAFDSH